MNQEPLNLEQVQIRLTQRLEDLRERRERIARHTRHREEPLPSDFAEQAIELENGETLVALDGEVRTEIRQIEDALRRLEDGSYGNCIRCGEPVAVRRLEALPHAALCIDCANIQ